MREVFLKLRFFPFAFARIGQTSASLCFTTQIRFMKIIAIANQKGGVGKTTTSVNLGACLAERGVQVLVLDMDPQANSTSALDFVPGENTSVYQALMGDSPIADLVLQTKYENLSLIPCDMDLAGCEIEMAREDDHLIRLRGILEEFRKDDPADYMLIDCPPSLGVLMTSSLAADCSSAAAAMDWTMAETSCALATICLSASPACSAFSTPVVTSSVPAFIF